MRNGPQSSPPIDVPVSGIPNQYMPFGPSNSNARCESFFSKRPSCAYSVAFWAQNTWCSAAMPAMALGVRGPGMLQRLSHDRRSAENLFLQRSICSLQPCSKRTERLPLAHIQRRRSLLVQAAAAAGVPGAHLQQYSLQ